MTLTPILATPGRVLATAGTLVSLSSAWLTSQADRNRLESLYAELGLQPLAAAQLAGIAELESFKWSRVISILHRLQCHAGHYAGLAVCQQHVLLRSGSRQPALCRVTQVDLGLSVPPFLLRRLQAAERTIARIGFGVELRFPHDSGFGDHYHLTSTEGLSTRALFDEQIRAYLAAQDFLVAESNGRQLMVVSAVGSASQASAEDQQIRQALDDVIELQALLRGSASRCFGEVQAA